MLLGVGAGQRRLAAPHAPRVEPDHVVLRRDVLGERGGDVPGQAQARGPRPARVDQQHVTVGRRTLDPVERQPEGRPARLRVVERHPHRRAFHRHYRLRTRARPPGHAVTWSGVRPTGPSCQPGDQHRHNRRYAEDPLHTSLPLLLWQRVMLPDRTVRPPATRPNVYRSVVVRLRNVGSGEPSQGP